jgi:glutathione synthase/RimK-type ligase-like ATP-grasp enzyme
MNIVDFALNWDYDTEEKFISLLKKECAGNHFSFVWIKEKNVKDILRQLEAHDLKIRVMLDSQATYNLSKDPYARVCYAVKDAGGSVINDPDRARMAVDKSTVHFELIDAGIITPYTVVVRNWEPKVFKLKEEERKRLGAPFIIKPGCGYGQLGVIRDAKGTIREIARARNFDRGDNFLLQEKVYPVSLNGKRAWFRVIHCFDTIIPCWWDDVENSYEHLSYENFNEFGLYKLVKIVARIASLTKMVWFSTEIAIDQKEGKRRFLAIDYVNDQCDMGTKSETPSGVPDEIVEYVASKMVSIAAESPVNRTKSKRYKIFLKDAFVELKGLGTSQTVLRQAV